MYYRLDIKGDMAFYYRSTYSRSSPFLLSKGVAGVADGVVGTVVGSISEGADGLFEGLSDTVFCDSDLVSVTVINFKCCM